MCFNATAADQCLKPLAALKNRSQLSIEIASPKPQMKWSKFNNPKRDTDLFLTVSKAKRSFTNHLEMEIKKEEKKEIKANHLEYLT